MLPWSTTFIFRITCFGCYDPCYSISLDRNGWDTHNKQKTNKSEHQCETKTIKNIIFLYMTVKRFIKSINFYLFFHPQQTQMGRGPPVVVSGGKLVSSLWHFLLCSQLNGSSPVAPSVCAPLLAQWPHQGCMCTHHHVCGAHRRRNGKPSHQGTGFGVLLSHGALRLRKVKTNIYNENGHKGPNTRVVQQNSRT